MRDWVLTEDAFTKLLSRLDSDVEQAGQKYEEIRRSLMAFFRCRECQTPEDLIDETFNRVARRLIEGIEIYTDNPFLYFYGVALNVLREYERKPPPLTPLPEAEDASGLEQRFECMRKCLQKLPVEMREMLAEYCQGDARAKAESRKKMAERMVISLNALRIKVRRLREQLESCVKKCLARAAD